MNVSNIVDKKPRFHVAQAHRFHTFVPLVSLKHNNENIMEMFLNEASYKHDIPKESVMHVEEGTFLQHSKKLLSLRQIADDYLYFSNVKGGGQEVETKKNKCEEPS